MYCNLDAAVSLKREWEVKGISRDDTRYSGPEGEILFGFYPVPEPTHRLPMAAPGSTYVLALPTMRFAHSEARVPEELRRLIAERVIIDAWEHEVYAYARDETGWCDDHRGNRWPTCASAFPEVRHADGWSLTDTRWGQNCHDSFVLYRDDVAVLRLERRVGYAPDSVTCVLFVPQDFHDAVVTIDGSVDSAWFERAKERMFEAYEANSIRATFVVDGQF